MVKNYFYSSLKPLAVLHQRVVLVHSFFSFNQSFFVPFSIMPNRLTNFDGYQPPFTTSNSTSQTYFDLNGVQVPSSRLAIKVDDMLMQYLVTKKRKSPIAIVTDSIADLPSSYLLEHQVHCLPINILSDNQVFLDKLTLDAKLVKEKIVNKQNLSTAQPAIPFVDALLSFLEDKYENVLVLTVSSELSGTYQLIAQRIKEMGLSEK
ncbi:DegV family protein, partial [Enterococcus faecalis]|nr:DegV family protein [Enterococcus faecalis]